MALAQSPYGKFWYYEPDCIGKEVARGIFVDEWLRSYMDGLHVDRVFIDIGASIGFYTVYMSKRGVKVHAFEASPEVFDLLRRNVEMNQCEGVSLYNEALFDSEKELWLERKLNNYPVTEDGKIDYEHTGNSAVLCLVPKESGEQLPGYNFVTRTLDSFKLDAGLIKVDTQGADLRILHGAEKTIKKCRPVVLFEHEPELLKYHNDNFDGFIKFFDSLGYSKPRYLGGVDYVAVPEG